jgi:hypothetical protein
MTRRAAAVAEASQVTPSQLQVVSSRSFQVARELAEEERLHLVAAKKGYLGSEEEKWKQRFFWL